jgi:hypothetical protein
MLRSFYAGSAYHLNGLEPEDHSIENTLRNLGSIGRPILGIIGYCGRVLLVFKTGEVYFASGFAVGRDCAGASALARYLVEHTDGDWTTQYEEMLEVVTSWEIDGPIYLPPPSEKDFDRSRRVPFGSP